LGDKKRKIEKLIGSLLEGGAASSRVFHHSSSIAITHREGVTNA